VLGIGGTELFIIAAFALLIFGPDKIPQMGKTVGKFMREFRRAQDTMNATIRNEMRKVEDLGKPQPVKPKTLTPDAAEQDDNKDEDKDEDEKNEDEEEEE